MKNILAVLVLSFALLSTAYSQNKHEYTITNKSGVTVTGIYASVAGKNSWGSNLITKGKIKNGGAYKIEVPVDASNCTWDIKYHDSKGKDYVMKNVNLCNSTALNLEKQKTKTAKVTRHKNMKQK